MVDMEGLVSEFFTKKWTNLHTNIKDIGSIDQSGVYALAWSSDNLEGMPIDIPDIYYVGMSCSKGGVRQRLKQFISGLESGKSHSAAMRFFRDVQNGTPYSQYSGPKKFYMPATTLECEASKKHRKPDDLRTMGQVTCLEYYLIAHCLDQLGKEPDLNKQ